MMILHGDNGLLIPKELIIICWEWGLLVAWEIANGINKYFVLGKSWHQPTIELRQKKEYFS